MRLFKPFYSNLRKEFYMIKVMFICHGNICRSPMAEFIFKDMIKKLGAQDEFIAASSATSREEIGNDIYPPAKRKLREMGIPFSKRGARQFEKSDYDKYDYIFIMERYNFVNLCRIIRDDPDGKVHLMTEFTDLGDDIADPWYSGNFDLTYDEIRESCIGFLKHLGYDTSKL